MIARRTGAAEGDLEPLLVAGVVTAAERAAVLHWFRRTTRESPLAGVVRAAIDMALRGLSVTSS